MIPVLRVKYTLEEVEWTLLGNKDKQIAVATLRGLTGEHNFCFDRKRREQDHSERPADPEPAPNDRGAALG